MLITFEPKVAQRSVASQNDHKSKACPPEASNAAFTVWGAFLTAFFYGTSTTLIQSLKVFVIFFLQFLLKEFKQNSMN